MASLHQDRNLLVLSGEGLLEMPCPKRTLLPIQGGCQKHLPPHALSLVNFGAISLLLNT